MGTPEQNKALVMRFIDCLYGGDVAGAAACFDAERRQIMLWIACDQRCRQLCAVMEDDVGCVVVDDVAVLGLLA